MEAITHLEKVIVGEVSAVTHIEKVIAGETSAVTYTEKVITGEAPPITHLQKVIAGVESPVTHLEYIWAGGSPTPTEHEYTGAVPVTFNADGEPLIDWIIYGNMVHNGTPTPDNPVTPQGTGERTGNLFDGIIEVGGLDINTGAETGQAVRRRSDYIEIEENTNYNLSRTITATTSNLWALFYDDNKDYISGSNKGTSDADFTVLSPANAKYLRWYVTANGSYDNFMIIEGSIAPSSYIPYGYKIPISSANTTTPVYLGEVQTTRKIKKLVLTGEETAWTKASSAKVFYLWQYDDDALNSANIISCMCSHYSAQGNVVAVSGVENLKCCFRTTAQTFYIHDDAFESKTDFVTYLQQQYANGTPVTVWYVLAEPETGIINEPLMKIGDYADTLSMEQAGVSIPTNNGSTTVDVETTLKPSEVYIKYKGV